MNIASASVPRFALCSSEDSPNVDVMQGGRVLWSGSPSDLVQRSDFDVLFTHGIRTLLRKAARVERRMRSFERGKERGCTPRAHPMPAPLPDHAYLGTPIYRVSYHDRNGRTRRSPGFALGSTVRKALELLRSKGYEATIVC